jgi:hypothetical protein
MRVATTVAGVTGLTAVAAAGIVAIALTTGGSDSDSDSASDGHSCSWSYSAAPAPAAPAPLTAEIIQNDLVLEATLTSPAQARPDSRIELSVALRNTSATRTHHVVKPGDGSEVGWREPHVYFTATLTGKDGVARDVPEANVGRCGLYDADWVKDVVALAPGETLEIKDWLMSPDVALVLDQPGQIALRVHYAFRPSAAKRSDGAVTPTGPIADVPDFELVSEPIAITLR